MKSVNAIYKEALDGELKEDLSNVKELQEESKRKYLERFELWCNDPTTQIVLSELSEKYESTLKSSFLSSQEEQAILYAREAKILRSVINLMTKGEYKI